MANRKKWTKGNIRGQAQKFFSKIPETVVGSAITSLLDAGKEQLALLENFKLVTVENFTAGLFTQFFCEDSKLSCYFDRGFILNDDLSVKESLGISENILQHNQRNSTELAEAMAKGALLHSNAKLAIAITGISDPEELLNFGSIYQLSFASCYQNKDEPSKFELKSYKKAFDCKDRNFVRLVAALEASILFEKKLIEFSLGALNETAIEVLNEIDKVEEVIDGALSYKEEWDECMRKRQN